MSVQAVSGGVPGKLHTCSAAPIPVAAGQTRTGRLELATKRPAAIKTCL